MKLMRGNPDRLHHAPDSNAAALLLIDVINDLEFDGAGDLLPSAMKMAAALAVFKRQAKEQGIPVIYVNDNFGRWRSDFPKLVEHCSREEARGREIVIRLKPEDDDYFVLKPKHSAFFRPTWKFFSIISAHRS